MPPHRYTQRRRTQRQARADQRAEHLATFLGRALRNARRGQRSTQLAVAQLAGLSQSCWSELERGRGANVSLKVWTRASDAVGADLRGYLEGASAADAPRDSVHLKHQELVARFAADGGWRPRPELDLGGAGVADIVLARPSEWALVEVWDWFADVGDAFRSWDRKIERVGATTDARVSGCWVIRATRRNRELVSGHRSLFAARFPGSSRAWLASFREAPEPMPAEAALVWVSVRGDRLFASRNVSGRGSGRDNRPDDEADQRH
jgi:transcriptional regulator with XRE-family HTH domain